MLQLIEYFQAQGSKIVFGTTAHRNENSIDLKFLGIETHNLRLNDTSFDALLLEINPSIVLFDRYITEEQFGWRVAEKLPSVVRVLDTEDLHCLRKVREKQYKSGNVFRTSDLLNDEITKREIAAILRSDLSLIISKFEMNLLLEIFQIHPSILLYLPFLLGKSVAAQNVPAFGDRRDFISIGNFLHAPNLDSVITLKKSIWPKIRKELPEANLHIYGAYPTQQIKDFHKPNAGFFVHGFVENQHEVLRNAKVLLAPLSFGAGLKGKFLDGMLNGCPSVTTSIGIEGYADEENWCGEVSNEWNDFTDKAIALYRNESSWNQSQRNGFELLQQFDKTEHESEFTSKLNSIFTDLDNHRNHNFMGSLLLHHRLKSTKYLSKWIEEKNKA